MTATQLEIADPPATPAPAGVWWEVGTHKFGVEPPADCTCPPLRLDAACEAGVCVMLYRKPNGDPDFTFEPVAVGERWPVPGSKGWVLEVHETRRVAGVWSARVTLEPERLP